MLDEECEGVVELFLETGFRPAFGEVEVTQQRRERDRLVDAGETIVMKFCTAEGT